MQWGGGFCLAKLAAASRRERVCFWQLSKRVRLISSKRSEAKHKSELDESVIYSDCWKAYDGLVDYGTKAHYRVKHSKNEF